MPAIKKQVRSEDLGEQPALRMDGRIVRSVNTVKDSMAKDSNPVYDFLMDLSDDRLCAAMSKTAKRALRDCVN